MNESRVEIKIVYLRVSGKTEEKYREEKRLITNAMEWEYRGFMEQSEF